MMPDLGLQRKEKGKKRDLSFIFLELGDLKGY
jgi:hypothetical protein